MGKGALTQGNAPETYFAITPNDSTLLQGLQWIRVGTAGNLVITGLQGGAAAVTLAVTAGEYVPFGAGFVMAASSAGGLVGFA